MSAYKKSTRVQRGVKAFLVMALCSGCMREASSWPAGATDKVCPFGQSPWPVIVHEGTVPYVYMRCAPTENVCKAQYGLVSPAK